MQVCTAYSKQGLQLAMNDPSILSLLCWLLGILSFAQMDWGVVLKPTNNTTTRPLYNLTFVGWWFYGCSFQTFFGGGCLLIGGSTRIQSLTTEGLARTLTTHAQQLLLVIIVKKSEPSLYWTIAYDDGDDDDDDDNEWLLEITLWCVLCCVVTTLCFSFW